MQTTLEIDEGLLAEARAKAKREGTTLDALVEAALRKAVAGNGHARAISQIESFDLGKELEPIGSLGAIHDLFDEIEIEEARAEGSEPRFR